MILRITLYSLVTFVAVTAGFCGMIMSIDPSGNFMDLQLSVLHPTPFQNFMIPGLILAVIVGGTHFVALISGFKKSPSRYKWTLAAGIMITGWITVQLLMIREFFWLQAVYGGIGIFIIVASLLLDQQNAAVQKPLSF